ncbi:MAG: murein biosynthesis integral membrane protein MurJ [Nannocystis sp.]|uniref:murein biosynthesis integral membrane protein MurJ n=1 Tax=Nannocystis sp. TaxID=1962667 RepID=UPI0024277736|nr:murein biosynthesis integral membrane protein MurJ [Nannocystis sp.]MBK9753904.1 murein biosynthesis integral membrane protein MurJ [Nannocystis sp.]
MSGSLQRSGSLSLAVAVSRVLGLLREALFSRLVGAGALADAYSVAFRIPNLLRDLLAEGALSSAFVPTFTAALVQEDRARADQLANLTLAVLLLVTGGLTLLGVVFADDLVRLMTAGWSPAKLADAAALTRIMMPLLALVSVGAVWTGMLNAQRHFLAPAYAPALFNVISVLCGAGLWIAGAGGMWAVTAWSIGTLAAGVVQSFYLLPPLWRLGYRPRLALRGAWRHPGVRRIARMMLPAVVGVAAIQVNIFVNTRFAASLGDGPVAQLEYAFRIFYLPIGMFGVALATIATTQLSEEAARGDRSGLVQKTGESLSALWLLTAASTVGLVVLAEPIVSLIYEGGRFTAADTLAVAAILRAYALGLVPYSMVKIVAPAFYATDRPRLPLLASLAAIAATIAFNAYFYRQLGAPGLALGTSLGALVNVGLLRLFFARKVGPLARPGRVRELAWLLLANAVMGGVLYAAWTGAALGLTQLALRGPLATLALALALLLIVGLGFLVYVSVLQLARFPGIDSLARLPRSLWRRIRRRPPAT